MHFILSSPYKCNDQSIDIIILCKYTICVCKYLLSLLYEHIFDLLEQFKDTQNYSRTFTNFLKIQGQEIFLKDISRILRTSRMCGNPT